MRSSFLILCLLISVPAQAASTQKEAAARKLASTLQINNQIEATRRGMEEETQAQMALLSEQFKKLGQEGADIDESLRTFGERIGQSWNAVEAERVFTQSLTEELTQAELVEAERFYRSKLGQKAIVAIHNANARMEDYQAMQARDVLKAQVERLAAKIEQLKQAMVARAKKSASSPKAP